MLGGVRTKTMKSSIYPRSRSPLKEILPSLWTRKTWRRSAAISSDMLWWEPPNQLSILEWTILRLASSMCPRAFGELCTLFQSLHSTFGETIKASISSRQGNTHTYSTKLSATSYEHISECIVPRGSSSERGGASAFLSNARVFYTNVLQCYILWQGVWKIS